MIDKQYDKWARFENFLAFAEKKEVKDRLKELDPPPMSNYIDPSTVDDIIGKRRQKQSNSQKMSQSLKAPP